ncbi:MAG: hypothetical protein LBV45_03590 [Xanthomonadaceae bacterium]|jgi:hypothetical protein|nr:hypothetical protein [Xanthomonadaceae bacterium]
MLIDEENYGVGNKAMASVLLLYWHLLREGGFTAGQTVYIDPELFDGFAFLDVRVDESRYSLEIDESLLRQGAVIYILCDFNDGITQYDREYLQLDIVHNVFRAAKKGRFSAVPEVNALIDLFGETEADLDRDAYARILSEIYQKYVVGRLRNLLGAG